MQIRLAFHHFSQIIQANCNWHWFVPSNCSWKGHLLSCFFLTTQSRHFLTRNILGYNFYNFNLAVKKNLLVRYAKSTKSFHKINCKLFIPKQQISWFFSIVNTFYFNFLSQYFFTIDFFKLSKHESGFPFFTQQDT